MTRNGLRLRFNDVNDVVRTAIIDFAKWLRLELDFSIRVVAYIKKEERIKNNNGEHVTATFFAPYNKDDEPYIRVATGDYDELRDKWGRDNALASILHSLMHEIAHYEQWLNNKPLDDSQAKRRASRLIKMYAETRAHP